MELLAPKDDATETTIDYPLSEPVEATTTASWPAQNDAAQCPHCTGDLINGQGVLDCPECDWTN